MQEAGDLPGLQREAVIMEVRAKVDAGVDEASRSEGRLPANTLATMRRPQEHGGRTIEIVDIAPAGCGFKSDWLVSVGSRIWLALPGLESWPATVAWSANCRGGLKFDRPLHPSVADRFAAQTATKSGTSENA